MARSETKRISKRERREERRRTASRRRVLRRLRWGALIAAVVMLPVLALLDCTGPDEQVKAEVVRTQRYTHVTQDGSHTHLRATLEIEGLSTTTIERADQMRRGEWVPVWIRRGRITGWPYFQDLAEPELQAAEPDAPPAPEAGEAPLEEAIP